MADCLVVKARLLAESLETLHVPATLTSATVGLLEKLYRSVQATPATWGTAVARGAPCAVIALTTCSPV